MLLSSGAPSMLKKERGKYVKYGALIIAIFSSVPPSLLGHQLEVLLEGKSSFKEVG